MKEKFRAIFRKDFPLLYKGKFGASCGDGWFELLYNLSEKLENELKRESKRTQKDIYITQIKEKFGTLRFYTSCATSKMRDYINQAECLSAYICEDCGKFGASTREYRGWWMTMCKVCYIKMCAKKWLSKMRWRYISHPWIIITDYFKGDSDEL